MGKLNAAGMAEVKKEQEERAAALKNLISKPFALNSQGQLNEKDLAELTKRMDHFEFSCYQMAVYQILSKGAKVGRNAYFLRKYVLPLPEFLDTLFIWLYCLGTAASLLENFRLTDFHAEFEEMREIYNHVFKNGENTYKPGIDNTAKLKVPALQRFVTLLAPFEAESIIVWERVSNKPKEEQGSLTKLGQFIGSGLITTASFFSNNAPQDTKPKANLTELIPFKTAVETGHFDKSEARWFQDALVYFTYNPSFYRDVLSVKVAELFSSLKAEIKSYISLGPLIS